jgi:hypothetical protein
MDVIPILLKYFITKFSLLKPEVTKRHNEFYTKSCFIFAKLVYLICKLENLSKASTEMFGAFCFVPYKPGNHNVLSC